LKWYSIVAGVLTTFLLPILATILYKQGNNLPPKVACEVSVSVKEQLARESSGMNKSILKEAFDRLLNGTELVKVAGDKDVKRAVY
jgi:hypothetical protein